MLKKLITTIKNRLALKLPYPTHWARVIMNEKTEELLMAQVWELTEVKIDGVVRDLYSGLTLSFGSKTYTTA